MTSKGSRGPGFKGSRKSVAPPFTGGELKRISSAVNADATRTREPSNPWPLVFGEKWRPVTVKFVVRSWTLISLNSARVAENVSVSISAIKRGRVQNLIPIALGIITVQLA